MKIVGFNYMGNQRICIMDNKVGVSASDIDGEAIVGATVELLFGKYTVTGAGSVACDT